MNKPLNRTARCRLNEAEDEAFLKAVKAVGEKSRSRILRKLIRDFIGQGPELLRDDLQVFREAVRQVGAVGRNLNQLARAANRGESVGSLESKSPVIFEVSATTSRLEKELIEIINRSKERRVIK